MKKVLSVILAIVMILSVVSVSAMAVEEVKADETISIGETKTVSLEEAAFEDYVIVKFAPLMSGLVAISSDSPEDVSSDPILEVYDDKMEIVIAEADDSEESQEFYLEFNCVAGDVYYLVMHNSKDATAWDISVTCLHETYVSGICSTCFALCDHTKTDTLVGCCPCGMSYVGVSIKDGKSITMFSKNDYFWLKFEPEETAPYLLTSDNTDNPATENVAADPGVIVVDETGDIVLASDDDISEENYNFALPFMFEKGEKYYIGIYDNNEDADNWTFTINKATHHTVEMEETVENEDGTTTTTTTTVAHELTFIPEQESTCEVAGHSNALYCATCDKYLAGNHNYDVEEVCIDEDADNKCDWCGESLVEEEPCECRCHSESIVDKIIWTITNFINSLFRLNSLCECGIRHYEV